MNVGESLKKIEITNFSSTEEVVPDISSVESHFQIGVFSPTFALLGGLYLTFASSFGDFLDTWGVLFKLDCSGNTDSLSIAKQFN